MNHKNFWKVTFGLGLWLLLISPAAGFATTESNNSGAGRANERAVHEYRKLSADYLSNCVDWENSRFSNAQLKRCLTAAKELRDKLPGFLAACESIVGEAKKTGKWSKELDDYFEKNAARHGVEAWIIAETRQDGGLRASYQKRSASLKNSKTDFDNEVNNLEARIRKAASLGDPFFRAISYSAAAEPEAGRARGIRATINNAGATAVHVVIRILCLC